MSDKIYKITIQNPKMGKWIDELAKTLVPLGFKHTSYNQDTIQRLGIEQVGTYGGYPIIQPPADFYQLFGYKEEMWVGSLTIKKTDKKRGAGHNFAILFGISNFKVDRDKLVYVKSIKDPQQADEWLVRDDNPIRVYNDFKKLASSTNMDQDDFDVLSI